MRTVITFLMSILFLFTGFVGCTGNQTEDEVVSCVDVDLGGDFYCVALGITETGFRCPTYASNVYVYNNVQICSANVAPSDDDLSQALEEARKSQNQNNNNQNNDVQDDNNQNNNQQTGQIDMLWVIDNSGSMCEEQDNLTRNIENFVNGLIELESDFRFAVVTTDMRDTYHMGRFQNTPATEASQVCEIQPNTSDCPSELPLVIESENYLVDGILNQEALQRDFRCIATVGTEGDGFEKGLMAAKAALSDDLLTTHNAGFLREDAYLVIIFLSDENDCSDNYILPRQNGNECEWRRDELVSVGEYAEFFQSLKSDPSKVMVASIVAPDVGIYFDVPDPVQPSCNVESQGEGFSGYRYIELTDMFGDRGISDNICQPQYDPPLANIIQMIEAGIN